jgi:LacI family gluconate utilization system Gnt-I transcriptional repressor
MHSAESRKRLKASGIPVGEAWDLTDKPIDRVIGFSHEAVGIEVARYLKGKGKKDIAIITGTDARAQIRRDSFCEAIGKNVRVVNVDPPTTIEAGREGLRLLLKGGKVDAIFCSSDMLALGVLIEAQAKGIKIPSELGVIGFSDLSSSKELEPALSSVRIDGTLIGRLAAEYFTTGEIQSQGKSKVVDLGFKIISRASI